MNFTDLKTLGHLIPLEKSGKKPIIKKWQVPSAELSDQAELHFALDQGNIGLALNNTTLVIDIDPRNGGAESYLKLIEDHPALEQPVTVTTASGGWHSYVTISADVKIKKQLKKYPGIDFLTKGSYVVAPPSNGMGQGWNVADTARYPLPALNNETLTSLFNQVISSNTDEARPSIVTPDQLEILLNRIDPIKYRGKHDDWMQVMAASSFICPDGADVFASWSGKDPEYSDRYDETCYRYATFTPSHVNPITGRTLRQHIGVAI
ncbi:MAG: bifunctional DNA primase/polymerase, partial [Deltaproteobacteria bacterium]|nr:bifunctional DNA primase/polymerase [Deltaproteobacteria bacterium]